MVYFIWGLVEILFNFLSLNNVNFVWILKVMKNMNICLLIKNILVFNNILF